VSSSLVKLHISDVAYCSYIEYVYIPNRDKIIYHMHLPPMEHTYFLESLHVF
jgi:hypothetical protein